nr:uncharacterized protein LOC128706612 [Cherax quadricarinatus]
MSRAGLRVVLPPHLGRGPSPTPETRHRLQVSAQAPTLNIGVGGGGGGSSVGEGGGSNLWGEEETELIRSCAALSTALGVQKSFSTSDISGVGVTSEGELSRTWVSEVRQNYLKRRLVTTYKALQRFSQSEVDLDAGGAATAGVKIDSGGVTLVVPPRQQAAQDVFRIIKKEVELPVTAPASTHVAASATHNKNLSLTARDVERDRGRPLTKYERNMMIFNWLQTLEETAYDIMS